MTVSKIVKSLFIGSFVGLATISGLSQSFSSNLKQVLILNEGINTCFSRVAQSYTAKVIGDQSSAYLANSFHNLTEECFGETIYTFEAYEYADSSKALASLNNLSKDVHWFHKKLNAQAAPGLISKSPQKIVLNTLGLRFEKLELARDEVLEYFEKKRVGLDSVLSSIRIFFYLFSFFTPFFFICSWYLSRRSKNSHFEDTANEVLLSGADNTKAENLFNQIFEKYGLKNVNVLFDAYKGNAVYTGPVDGNEFQGSKDSLGKSKILTSRNKLQIKEQIDEMWDSPGNTSTSSMQKSMSSGNKVRKTVLIENSFTKVLDLLSGKIIKDGIFVETDTFNAEIFGEEESVEQIFYHVLMNFINRDCIGDKNIFVGMKQLGGTLLITFQDNGQLFSADFLKTQCGLAEQKQVDSEYLELMICKELVDDMRGKISFENIKKKNSDECHRQIKISVPSIKKSKVRYVEKTTKKELVDKLKSPQKNAPVLN